MLKKRQGGTTYKRHSLLGSILGFVNLYYMNELLQSQVTFELYFVLL